MVIANVEMAAAWDGAEGLSNVRFEQADAQVHPFADDVFDVSAFVFPGGPPEAVYRQVLSGELTLIVSRPLLAELGRVLFDKFDWQPAYAEEVVAQLVRIGELVEPRETVEDVDDDPDDNRGLEAAAEGDADVIVSGDRHLLALGSWRNIPIVTPAGFPDDA